MPLANSSKVEIGDHVAVIGSPLGLEGSLSEGIVSAKRELPDRKRPLPTPVESMEHYPPTRNFELPVDSTNWLQITAPISPGSSGSPVLDAKGDVIGIATMVLRGGQSLNFAVPAEVVIAMLETPKEHNEKQRPLVAFEELLNDEYATQNIIENVFNVSPEWRDATEAYNKPVDWAKALDLAKIVVAKYPNIVRSWWHLGGVYDKMGLPEEAIAAYQQAITLAKEQGDSVSNNSTIMTSSWAALGSIYKKTQRTTEAQFAFSQAIAGQTREIEHIPNPEAPPPPGYTSKQVPEWRRGNAVYKATALNELAGYYAEDSDIEHAKGSYLQAIRENPYKHSNFADMLLTSLADVCIKQGDEEAAFIQLYDAMVLSQSQNPEAEAWHKLSLAYFGAGMEEASFRCDRKARSLGHKP